jgi:hypothetical protein
MTSTLPKRASAKGVAAVELTIWLPLLVLLLGAGIFLGRLFWHYTVSQKAAHDAAIFLASASAVEMRAVPVGGSTETPIAVIARKIAADEIAELNPGGRYQPAIMVLCDGVFACTGQSLPRKITVSIQMSVTDDFLPDITSAFVSTDGILLQSYVTLNYVGN